MPNYVTDAILSFHHLRTKPTFSASSHTPSVYGRHQQMSPAVPIPRFTPVDIKRLEKLCGKFLYYGRAFDSTIIHAINDLTSQISMGTANTTKATTHFLNYYNTGSSKGNLGFASLLVGYTKDFSNSVQVLSAAFFCFQSLQSSRSKR